MSPWPIPGMYNALLPSDPDRLDCSRAHVAFLALPQEVTSRRISLAEATNKTHTTNTVNSTQNDHADRIHKDRHPTMTCTFSFFTK
jgi:hypothetical protein